MTLIDTGLPSASETISRALVAKGYPLHRVQRIILTHGDADHMGSAAKLRRATGAPILCHTVEKDLVEHPWKRRPNALLLRPLFAVVRQFPLMKAEPVTPEEIVVDGQELPEGLTVITTPGHTAGHISLLDRKRRILIAGDALSNRKGKLAPPPGMFTPDMKNAERSIWKLAKKYGDEIDVIVFGHGPPILNNGGARLKAMASRIFASEV